MMDFLEATKSHQAKLPTEKPAPKQIDEYDVQNILESLRKLSYNIRLLDSAINKINYFENYLTELNFKVDRLTQLMTVKEDTIK